MSTDPHAPTAAGPSPVEGGAAPAATAGTLPFGLSEKLPPAVIEKIPPEAAAKASELAERPEVLAGAAFAGGVLAAQLLKLVGR